MQLTLDVVMHK